MIRPTKFKAPPGRQTTAQGKEHRDAALGPPPPANSKAMKGRTISAQGKEPRDAALGPPSQSSSKAPTGRNIPAQGKEQRDAALGSAPPQNPSPEGAAQSSEWIPIGDWVTDDIDPSGPSGSEDFIYVDIGSVDRDSKLIIDPKSLAVEKAPSRAKQVLKSGDVLVSMTRPNLNAVAIVPPKLDGAIGSTGFHVLRASHADPGFFILRSSNPSFHRSDVPESSRGALPSGAT